MKKNFLQSVSSSAQSTNKTDGFRILMFSVYLPPEYSGAAKQALSLSKALRDRGHTIEFATVRWPGLSESEVIDGFKVRRISMPPKSRYREAWLWTSLFCYIFKKRNSFDIIHSHGATYLNSVVGPIAKLAGLKSLVKITLANADLKGLRQKISGRLHFFFLRYVDAYVATSLALEDEIRRAGLPVKRSCLIPNGVDTIRFSPCEDDEKLALRKELDLPANRRIFLVVGVLGRRKGIPWLIREWVRTRGGGTESLLVAVGPQSRLDKNGEEMRNLQNLASLNSKLVKMVEHVELIEKYYKAADLFVLPSEREGLPNVILEAMSCGLPCIATKASGTIELVQNGRNGALFDFENIDSLIDAIKNIDQDKLSELGKNARQYIVKSYSIEAVALSYEKLYRELLGL